MKRFLLLGLGAGMTALTFSSYTNGPFSGGAGNHTGSAGSVANCSTGSNCHATNTTNTSGGLGITTLSNGIVSKYTPGTTYKVTITAANTSASLPKCGFQASCVKATSTSTQAGSFTSTTSNISVKTFGTLQLVEHNTQIAAVSSSGSNNVYQVSFNWTAPAAGTGMVRFYSTFNAVNGNGLSSGDQPNAFPSIDLDEATSGVSVASVASVALAIYPNPATDALHLKLEHSGIYSVLVFDMEGRTVDARTLSVQNGEATIETAKLKAGNYYITARQDGRSYSTLFVKH